MEMKIYTPSTLAREYSPLGLNYIKGCDHGCVYCYVQIFKWKKDAKYNHSVVSTEIDLDMIEESAKEKQGCNKQIFLSFYSDPYCIAENGQTRSVLEILNKYNHKVVILTKNPEKALKDVDIIKKFGNRIAVGTTLTFIKNEDSLNFEPNAPSPRSRFENIFKFHKFGIKTWVSFEPIIYPEQTLLLLKNVVSFIDFVKIGKVNHFDEEEKKIDYPKFLIDAVNILREANMDDKFYIKKDLAAFNTGAYLSKNELNKNFLNL